MTQTIKGDIFDQPIPATALAHTGFPDGDDSGYRDAAVLQADVDGQSDDLVGLPEGVKSHVVYALGSRPRICSLYRRGLGAANVPLIRQPAAKVLRNTNWALRPYGRELLVLDAFRSSEIQADLFSYVFRIIAKRKDMVVERMTARDVVQTGLETDEIASYAKVVEDDVFRRAYDQLVYGRGVDWPHLERCLGKNEDELKKFYLIFRRNVGLDKTFALDVTAMTAHGSGGSADAILLDIETGQPTNLGVPFDYVGPCSAMRYFEEEENLDAYCLLVELDPVLRRHLHEFGISEVTLEVFHQIQRERRLFFHTMKRVGATHYVNECWHWNFGNEHGGKQREEFFGAGNGCHSVLRDIRTPDRTNYQAVWGNAFAQRRAAEILGQ